MIGGIKIMKKYILILFLFIFLSGCGSLSPRQDQKIDNSNGKIDEIKNNQGGIISEIGNLKNQQEIQNSKLERIQQGLLNIQNSYQNTGVQIFSGPGGLIVAILGFFCLTIVILHYKQKSDKYKETCNILTESLVNLHNPILEEKIFQAVMYTNSEDIVLELMNKAKNK
jgi:predicted PurR-regulated permease PerM